MYVVTPAVSSAKMYQPVVRDAQPRSESVLAPAPVQFGRQGKEAPPLQPVTGLRWLGRNIVNSVRTLVNRPSLKSRADHELGHMLMYSFVGRRPELITIARDYPVKGAGGVVLVEEDKRKGIDGVRLLLEEVLVSMAGNVLQGKHQPNALMHWNANSDMKNRDEALDNFVLFNEAYQPPEKQQALLESLEGLMDRIFDKIPAASLAGMRRELTQRRTIEGIEDCADFLKRHLNPHFDWDGARKRIDETLDPLSQD